ncbi:phage tail sheath family protein [Dyadobacter fanqingshengii]|uniref:Phage tail sheath subtilisin-like domain-containing protein n=1 Tax=Dyadobacter fanqingshengii TaxID=2906443 RepID=A0A9X1T9B5_9BACT|nr:phage tail sheath C-terminal domain-containing protein [Dyadobacter fanqingshengii]MCF0039769.1 phage tail sheath subtilisin-like domain-containing protein [Dyadobacter fanqingshengii]USJ38468.1 phage tail sheath subtilisin-like domain-containing protein [Dyadobacter fanqingshengii]
MAEFKTPGVYIQEISTLPASIVPVATAIPAFVGYTAQRLRNGETFEVNIPVRVTSYLEYKEIFGESFFENYTITITDGPTVAITDPANFSQYLMTYQVYMYFSNGGGPCWIVSVGDFVDTPTGDDIDVNDLLGGLKVLEEEDEPTLLVIPEAAMLSDVNRKTLHDQMLAQCAKLQDRFALMDALHYANQTVAEDGADFRAEVGNSDLKYGASYYPGLRTILFRNFNPNSLTVTDNRGGAGLGPFNDLPISRIDGGPIFAAATIRIINNTNISGDGFTIGGKTFTEGAEFIKGDGPATTAQALLAAIQNAADPSYTANRQAEKIILVSTLPREAGAATVLTYNDSGGNAGGSASGNGTFSLAPPDKTLYNTIIASLKSKLMDLYPSASMAGVYARIDSQRGVWKAPANVDLRSVERPTISVSPEEQGILNVDATSGKSINVIRFFQGKGTLVWGARTLAGNDNEWKFIPVRRLYIFIEESVKKATEFVVFEPNDANTWLRVKTMVENFLSNLWREGALAGAKSEEAFFVRIGLGQTMTALDILEGRMNVEIGLAAVRPTEFIILKFSHKLQES